MSEPIRLNKYLADNHYCSRREADRLIASGRVFLNNKKAKLGDKVGDSDVVRVEGRDRGIRDNKIYLLLNKPAGISTNKKSEHTVFDILKSETPVYPIGDLDIHDEGLLLFTNDAFFSKRLSLTKFSADQEFVVEATRPITRGEISRLQNGIQLKDGMTRPAKVRQLDSHRFAIVLSESKPNLIRHMCKELNLDIETLMRTRILTLKMVSTYPVGNFRHLTESEIQDLKDAVGINVKQKITIQKPWTANKKKKLARNKGRA